MENKANLCLRMLSQVQTYMASDGGSIVGKTWTVFLNLKLPIIGMKNNKISNFH